jgi:hypothetical protein
MLPLYYQVQEISLKRRYHIFATILLLRATTFVIMILRLSNVRQTLKAIYSWYVWYRWNPKDYIQMWSNDYNNWENFCYSKFLEDMGFCQNCGSSSKWAYEYSRHRCQILTEIISALQKCISSDAVMLGLDAEKVLGQLDAINILNGRALTLDTVLHHELCRIADDLISQYPIQSPIGPKGMNISVQTYLNSAVASAAAKVLGMPKIYGAFSSLKNGRMEGLKGVTTSIGNAEVIRHYCMIKFGSKKFYAMPNDILQTKIPRKLLRWRITQVLKRRFIKGAHSEIFNKLHVEAYLSATMAAVVATIIHRGNHTLCFKHDLDEPTLVGLFKHGSISLCNPGNQVLRSVILSALTINSVNISQSAHWPGKDRWILHHNHIEGPLNIKERSMATFRRNYRVRSRCGIVSIDIDTFSGEVPLYDSITPEGVPVFVHLWVYSGLLAALALNMAVLAYGFKHPEQYNDYNVDPTSATSLALVVTGIVVTFIKGLCVKNWNWYDFIRGTYYTQHLSSFDMVVDNVSSPYVWNLFLYDLEHVRRCISNYGACLLGNDLCGNIVLKFDWHESDAISTNQVPVFDRRKMSYFLIQDTAWRRMIGITVNDRSFDKVEAIPMTVLEEDTTLPVYQVHHEQPRVLLEWQYLVPLLKAVIR